MTTTTEAPVAPQPVADPTVPALLHDDGGYFRMVGGQRIPQNAPGIAVLDGTPAEAAIAAMISLNTAMEALKAQYEAQVLIVKDVIGDRGVATLHGERAVDWLWSTKTLTDNLLVKALLSPADWKTVTRLSPSRSFAPKFKRH